MKTDVGIIDIQLYIPRYFLDQIENEEFDKAGKGKYTIGLGQQKMSFLGDREDINSICLSVLEQVLTRNRINTKDVGRLEVGTETFLDKSKSIKTFLMSLFPDNHDIEGVTTSNACYGGTNALLNAINWINSSLYNGKYAIVVMADVAVYEKGNARATGGCGAVAILLGRNPNIIIENVRSTYINHVYDFYKPNPSKVYFKLLGSEYPVVDGVFSMECYLKALENCYKGYLEKSEKVTNLSDFDYFCFHSPFSKMVEKAFFHLVGYDLK